jgi:hypothetical protein
LSIIVLCAGESDGLTLIYWLRHRWQGRGCGPGIGASSKLLECWISPPGCKVGLRLLVKTGAQRGFLPTR